MKALHKQPDHLDTALHVMLMYEGFHAGILAKRIYDGICGRLPAQGGARLNLWRFDRITNHSTERRAYHDFTKADVLMIAADGCNPLPLGVEQMLGRWLLAKRVPRVGLVEILHGMEELEKELSPVHTYLDGLAKKAKADFFSQAIGPAAQNGDSNLISARRPLTLDFVWDEDSFAISVPTAGWGH